MSLTENEIFGSAKALQQTFTVLTARKQELERFFNTNRTQQKFVFIGSGSGYMLSKGAARLFGTRENSSAIAIAGGDYLLNPDLYQFVIQDAIVITLSRSGLTSEVVQSVRHIHSHSNAKILSVTLNEQNSLAGISDLTLTLPFAYDHSVCQTRSVVTLYSTSLLLCAFCFKDKALLEEIEFTIQHYPAYISQYTQALKTIAEREISKVVVLADGVLNGIGEVGALAFSEIALMQGSYFNILDFRHGPIALIHDKTLLIMAIQPEKGHYQADMLADLKSYHAPLITFSVDSTTNYTGDLDVSFAGLKHIETYGIPFIFIMQWVAYQKAVQQGINPDKPANLFSYVSLEETNA